MRKLRQVVAILDEIGTKSPKDLDNSLSIIVAHQRDLDDRGTYWSHDGTCLCQGYMGFGQEFQCGIFLAGSQHEVQNVQNHALSQKPVVQVNLLDYISKRGPSRKPKNPAQRIVHDDKDPGEWMNIWYRTLRESFCSSNMPMTLLTLSVPGLKGVSWTFSRKANVAVCAVKLTVKPWSIRILVQHLDVFCRRGEHLKSLEIPKSSLPFI